MMVIFKRIALLIPLLVGITFVSFLIMRLAPGDPTSMMFDPKLSAHDQAQLRANLGLDQPVYTQYWHWLREVSKGNLGYSYTTGKPVLGVILERLPATLLLSVSSLILILALTLPMGIYSAARQGSWVDKSVTFFTFLGMSIPTFWLGLMLMLILSVWLNWLPSSGLIDPELTEASWIDLLLNCGLHLILPLLTIVIGGLASLTRYHRSGALAILTQPYIQAAKARGLSERVILFKHVLKNAALPVITLLGLELPSLIGGSFVIEYIFAWPGMGQLGITAIFSRDYPVIMGILLASSILLILGNLLADLAYSWIDPRISL